MHLIVGLGNPGPQYAETFHNMGFLCLEALKAKLGLSFSQRKCKAEVAETYIREEKAVFARPQTFMNLSGESVRELVNFYKLPLDRVMIVYDDLDLDRGIIRIRPSGTPGTHNGMRNVCYCLNTPMIPRIRVGIGRPAHPGFDVKDYVLARIPKEDQPLMVQTLNRAADAVIEWIGGASFDDLMQKYNAPDKKRGRPPKKKPPEPDSRPKGEEGEGPEAG